MDRQNGKKGYHAMKEQKLDDLERMFRDGLQDLKSEPDAAVWLAIQDAMKKRRRFWFFWGLTGMVAIGLVATMLLQNQSMDHGPLTIASGSEETRGPGDGVQNIEPKERHPEQANGSPEPGETPGRVEGPEPDSRHPEQANGSPEPGESSRRVERPEPDSRHPAQANVSPEPGETPRRVEGPEPQERHPERANDNSEQVETPRRVEGLNMITSLQIPFTYPDLTPINPVFVSAYQPKGKHDTDKTNNELSPWSLAFNPGLLLPSIQSYGKKGDVNYEKTNESRPGISMALFLNYTFKEKWTLRTGLDWSSYTVSGNHRYFGKTDTVEWIDRKRNTGVQVIEKSRSWQFESQYQWIGIPVELGRRQTLGAGFSWDWTFGAGLNYLYSYDKIAEGNKYLVGTDEGIKRMQLSLLAGFGVNYQLFGPWSSFVNVQYRLQPNALYASGLLREKHQILRFGIGLQYQFNRKGN